MKSLSLRQRLLDRWVLAGLAGSLLAASIVSWIEGDPDFWWHIADGRWILSHLALPTHSPWLFGAALSHHWIMAEYGSEIWMFLAGKSGVIIITALAFMATCYLAAYRTRLLGSHTPTAALLAPIIVALLGWAEIAPRDQMATTLGVAIIALVCELQVKDRRVMWWLLPPMFLLWVNLHPGFVGGMGLWASAIVFWTWQQRHGKMAHINIRTNLIWFSASFVATFINPYTYRIWPYVIKTLAGGGASFIQEWQSPNFHWVTFWPVLLLVLAFPMAWPRMSGLSRLWVIVLLAASLVTGRNVELLGAVAAAPLTTAWTSYLPSKSNVTRPLFVMVTILGLLLATYAIHAGTAAKVTNKTQPVSLVNQIRNQYPAGADVVPPYSAAGYILYNLPRDRVWIFGDNALIGDQIMNQYISIIDLTPKWRTLLRQSGANLVITSSSEPLQQGLLLDSQCKVLYNHDGWAAFTGNGPKCPILPLPQPR